MAIIRCDGCDRLIDDDYDPLLDTKDGMLCGSCQEESDENEGSTLKSAYYNKHELDVSGDQEVLPDDYQSQLDNDAGYKDWNNKFNRKPAF